MTRLRVRAAGRQRRISKRKSTAGHAQSHPDGAAASHAGAGAVTMDSSLRAIVGLGSSAGGLEALEKFSGAPPSQPGMAFVLVQHLAPGHESFMAELVGLFTAMPVVQVRSDTPVEVDHVYCIPPGR